MYVQQYNKCSTVYILLIIGSSSRRRKKKNVGFEVCCWHWEGTRPERGRWPSPNPRTRLPNPTVVRLVRPVRFDERTIIDSYNWRLTCWATGSRMLSMVFVWKTGILLQAALVRGEKWKFCDFFRNFRDDVRPRRLYGGDWRAGERRRAPKVQNSGERARTRTVNGPAK